MSVAARTFALYKINNNNNYILNSDVSDQCYISIEQMKLKWKNDFDKYYNKILNVVFNEGVLTTNANGHLTLNDTNEEFDTIYANIDVIHEANDKIVYVYKTADSNYQNYIGTENSTMNSLSYVNLTAPALTKVSIEVDKVDEENYNLGDSLDHNYTYGREDRGRRSCRLRAYGGRRRPWCFGCATASRHCGR